jgi:hypothetical protein
MPLLTKTRNFLRNLFSFGRRDNDLDQEIQSHLQMLIGENVRAGMSPREAERAARIELGGAEQVKEQVREARIGNWLHSVLSDVRYSLRVLRKSPGFTIVAVSTLALAISANAVVFGVLNAMILRPMNLPQEQSLYGTGAGFYRIFGNSPRSAGIGWRCSRDGFTRDSGYVDSSATRPVD